MTHALKNDEERRYQEEAMRFNRVLGPGRGGSGKGGTARAAKK